MAERQQSRGLYARTDDVTGMLLGAGNDYFHQQRRHQFCGQQHVDLDSCQAEHVYESPNHDRLASPTVMSRQLYSSYYDDDDSTIIAS